MKNYTGVIIEESLEDKTVLQNIEIINTKVEKVIQKHQTPWVKQWTLHNVIIEEEKADEMAKALSVSLDSEHSWYADYKSDKFHYVIFRDKVFKVDRAKKAGYDEVTQYGISLGIPDYQVDFSPRSKRWER
jgi:hypothetical protein